MYTQQEFEKFWNQGFYIQPGEEYQGLNYHYVILKLCKKMIQVKREKNHITQIKYIPYQQFFNDVYYRNC
jgi:hypothetical protein